MSKVEAKTNKFGINFLSGIGAQLFVVFCNFFSVPFLLDRFGVEAYGLVAFYATLQIIFSILDGGVSPLLIRQTSASLGRGPRIIKDYSALLQISGLFFLITSLFGFIIVFLGAGFISTSWLTFEVIDTKEVVFVIQIMAFVIALRWFSGFYRAIFVGNQNIHILSFINIFIAVLRFLIVLLFLRLINGTVLDFFKYQLFCSLIELILLYFVSKRVNFNPKVKTTSTEKITVLKSHYQFALYAAAGSIIWIVLTQTDKLIVSKIFDLSIFSTFSLGALGASVFFFLTSPLSNAVIPRLTEIHMTGKEEEFLEFYETCLTLCTLFLFPLVIIVYIFSFDLMFLWTNNLQVSEISHNTLSFYSLGNGLAVIGSFAYFLQSARGTLRLHFYGSMGFLIFFIPTLFVLLNKIGIDGAGMAWMFVNAIAFIFWCGYLHHVYLKNFFAKWLVRVFSPTVIFSFCLSYVQYLTYNFYPNNHFLIFTLVLSSILNISLLYVYIYGLNKEPLQILFKKQ